MYDYLIVGAGLFGSTFAWHARQAGKSVLVVDVRPHVGGNCYTYDEGGIHVHAYGPHIFHTSSKRIWDFVNQFATFRPYVHRVKAINGRRIYSMPVNMMTLHQLWGVTTPEEARQQLEHERIKIDNPQNLEEFALSEIGPRLYEALILGYTAKQWGRSPNQLPANILRRLPIRLTWDDNYFNDRYQGIPSGGYTQIFDRLLEGCDVRLSVDFFKERAALEAQSLRTVYTGKIDEFFGYRFGELEYRTLRFDTRILNVHDHQGIAQLNYTAGDVPWTRVVEHKHFDPVDTPHTVVTWEYPEPWSPGAVPYYPVNDEVNDAIYDEYKKLAQQEGRTVFGGRLASYKYRDMHQVIAEAMTLVKKEGLTT